ncbi:uncharacterized protein LOC132932719 isoform X2 [Metopolophium dirhodum]|uniref:uncharacterized protein LOC132932719 isoform X2 n=1 Tax=Metopolophium dirhodum TaxID=44670 RepID=UPI00299001FB|nr:uncharacterized protein LOC132932719 isoform X2 [Metopolophium dirhodum]
MMLMLLPVNYMLKTLLKILHGIQLKIIMFLWYLKISRKLLSLKLIYWMIVCGKVESKLPNMLTTKVIWSYPWNVSETKNVPLKPDKNVDCPIQQRMVNGAGRIVQNLLITMSRQMHSDNFESCIVCLRQPEANRNINFIDVYKPLYGGKTIKEYLKDLFDITVEPSDQKLRILCEICYIKMIKIKEKRQSEADSIVFMDYLCSKKPSCVRRSARLKTSFDANNYEQVIDKPKFSSKAFSNNKENSKFISSSNQTKKHKKLRRKIVVRKEISTDEDESNDPNELRYCLCNGVEYGTMVACDNKKCLHEWFHYECIGITKRPQGKWYCPECSIKLKIKR